MKKKPNIILIIADQQRPDFIGANPVAGKTFTPCLDKIAMEGVSFNNAFCNSPLCSPSRAAMASGRYGMNSGCFTNLHQLPPGTPSFVKCLRNAGYHTIATGKTHMEIHAYDSDLTSGKHREYMNSLGWNEICEVSGNGMFKTGIKCAYSKYLKSEGMFDDVLEYYRRWRYFMDNHPGFPDFHAEPWPFEEKYQESSFILSKALANIERNSAENPFFMHIGFAAPHSPLEPNPRFLDLYRNNPETPPAGAELTGELEKARKGYRAMISQIDSYVGQIIDTLSGRGLLENTILIYTADHGEMAGDFGKYGKTCFYDGSVRVPLIVSGSGIRSGEKNDALVELIDLGVSICELAGIESHPLDQGRSFVPLLKGTKNRHRENVYSEMGCDKMLFDGRFKLMMGDPGSDTRKLGKLHLDRPVNISPSPIKLYDLKNDPMELDDLAGNKNSAELLQNLKEKLLLRIYRNTQSLENMNRGTYTPLQRK